MNCIRHGKEQADAEPSDEGVVPVLFAISNENDNAVVRIFDLAALADQGVGLIEEAISPGLVRFVEQLLAFTRREEP